MKGYYQVSAAPEDIEKTAEITPFGLGGLSRSNTLWTYSASDYLEENDLIVNCSKCILGAFTIDFLGYRVSAAGIAPLPTKVAAIHVHPVNDAPISLTVDASNRAIGGVLEQLVDCTWRPIAFFSAPLQGHQVDWPPFDRELLAA